MALLNRLSGGVLLVIFLSANTAVARTIEDVQNTPGTYCTLPSGCEASSSDSRYDTQLDFVDGWCGSDFNPPSNSTAHSCSTVTVDNKYYAVGRWCRSVHTASGLPYQRSYSTGPLSGICVYSDEVPECSIPEGTEMGLSVKYMMGSTCYSNCVFTRSGRGACTYLDDGSTSCWSKYTSTGNYCEDEDGSSSRPFSDHTDDKGCYRSTADGKAYCEQPNDYQCPNFVIVDGKKYCRETNEDEWDSDGDGNPDSTDPSPGDPNHGGDPGDDGGGGDGGDSGGDDSDGGNGESSGGEYGQGVCEPGQQVTEPECEPHLDAIQCGIFLNSWNLRCEEKQRHEDFIGTDDFRESDSLADGDNPDNTVDTKEVSFSGFLDGLADSGSGFGGARSCPPDKQLNLGFGSITLPFTYICRWAEKIRPLIIALGWLAAGLIALKAMSEKG